jgi:hypothetical protein
MTHEDTMSSQSQLAEIYDSFTPDVVENMVRYNSRHKTSDSSNRSKNSEAEVCRV